MKAELGDEVVAVRAALRADTKVRRCPLAEVSCLSADVRKALEAVLDAMLNTAVLSGQDDGRV